MLEWLGRLLNVSFDMEVAQVDWCGVIINQLLFADDTALVSDSEKLRKFVNEFGRICERRKLSECS